MRLVGRAGTAFFDFWTLVHVAVWFIVGADLLYPFQKQKFPLWLGLFCCLPFAYLWECFEQYYLEPRGHVRRPENYLNRWVSDPIIALLIGFLAGWYGMQRFE